MSDLPESLSFDEYLAWAEAQPGRHELVRGRVIAMAPERVRHAEVKLATQVGLLQAIRKAGKPCQVLPDGLTVRIDQATAFEPDAIVRCGPRLGGDLLEIPDPLIVVEVLSPSTRGTDSGAKLAGYFLVPSLRHYLMVDADRGVMVHHRRSDRGLVETSIIGFGAIELDPPGIELGLDAIFGAV